MTDDLMTALEELGEWYLRYERNGTEDVVVICEADGEELFRSRDFWLTEGDDSIPPTLGAILLAAAAPALLKALKAVLTYAEDECRSLAECFRRDGDETVRIKAAACEQALQVAYIALSMADAQT